MTRELIYSQPVPRRAKKKPGPTARYRAKRKRAEGPVGKRVRALCVQRDGDCRYWLDMFVSSLIEDVTDCAGPSEWAHLGDGTRAKTRGMPPEQRHTTAKSLMLCQLHHDRYDGRQRPRLTIRALTDAGADGPLEFS